MQIRNIKASASSCYSLFDNGHSVGTARHKSERIDAEEYLIPNRGIILSTAVHSSLNTTQLSQRDTITSEPDLEAQILGHVVDVFDACFVQFEFSCPIDAGRYTTNVDVRYVFGSEVYNSMNRENVANDRMEANYHNNDAFGVFLNGKNIALVPDRDGKVGEDGLGILPVTINNINSKVNSQFFVSNNPSHSEINGGGYTTELRAVGQVFPGWNSIKFVVGDAGDRNHDSWVFIKAGSFSCTRVEPITFPTESVPTDIDLTETLPTNSTPMEYGQGEDRVVVKYNLTIPLSMAVGTIVLVGLLALAMPLIGLSFCDKKQTCGCGRKGKRYGKAKKVAANENQIEPVKTEPV